MLIIIAFLISTVSFFIAYWIGYKFSILDKPNKRKIHTSPIPRTGGWQIFFGFIVTYLFFHHYFSFFIPVLSLTLIFLIGAFEDKIHISFKIRLLLVVLPICLFIFPKNYLVDIGFIKLPLWVGIPFTIFALIGIINAFNFIDGIDGLSSGLGIIGLFFLFLLSIYYKDMKLADFILIGIGAILGFFVPNFLFGKIFMGDCGSYFIGGFAGFASILLFTRHPEISPWAPLLIFFVPVFDVLFSIYRRKRKSKGIFTPDKLHLHHRLLKRYHENQKKVVFVILGFQLFVGILAYFFHKNLLFLIFLTLFCIIVLRRIWYKELSLGLGKFRITV